VRAEQQEDLDAWLVEYNEQRTHQGKMCRGRTPLETFIDGIRIWKKHSARRPCRFDQTESRVATTLGSYFRGSVKKE
jgi:hypothetical protein